MRMPSKHIVLIGTATAFSLLGDQALYSVLPVYFETLGLVPIEVGIILSANRWIRLLTNHFAHRMTQRFRSDFLFVGALLIGTLTTAVYALSNLFIVLLAARLAWGLAWSFIRHVGVLEVMRDVPAGAAGQTMGMYNGISRLGSVAGLFGGALLVAFADFSTAMYAIACISLLAIPIAIKVNLPNLPLQFGQPVPLVVTTKDMRIYAAIGFVLGVVGPGLVTATLGAVFAQRLDGLTVAESAATLTGATLALRYVLDSLAAPWLGRLADRFGIKATVFGFTFSGGIVLLFAASVPNVYLVAILTIGFFIAGTALQAGVTGAVSQMGSRPFRDYTTFLDFGSAVGPLLGWWLLDTFSFDAAGITLGGGLYLIVALVVLLSRVRLQDPSHGRLLTLE